MSVSKKKLIEWLYTLNDGDQVGIDDGGLTLVVEGSDTYFEIGGIPEDDEVS